MIVPKHKLLEPYIPQAVHKDEIDTMTQLHDTRVLEITAFCRIADALVSISSTLADIEMHLADQSDTQ